MGESGGWMFSSEHDRFYRQTYLNGSWSTEWHPWKDPVPYGVKSPSAAVWSGLQLPAYNGPSSNIFRTALSENMTIPTIPQSKVGTKSMNEHIFKDDEEQYLIQEAKSIQPEDSIFPGIKRILEGEDHVLSEAEIPYKLLGNLGFGAHGFVEKVKDVTSGNCYARKTFRADKTSLFKAQEMLRLEVQIIRELASHPHVIRVHATYISGRTLAIILQPVADGGNLTQFLADYRDLGEGHPDKLLNRQTLIRTFGCLAHSLEYLHSDSYPHKPVIRHKDIKPTNILIHEGSPIFTDFGISRRCIDNQTTTSGRPEVFTLRYCAPEVADYDDRNRKADVFSLGCVFLEILASLHPGTFDEDFMDNSEPYHRRIETISSILESIKSSNMAAIVAPMLRDNPVERLAVSTTLEQMRDANAIMHCGKCHSFTTTNTVLTKEATAPQLATQPIHTVRPPPTGVVIPISSLTSVSTTASDIPHPAKRSGTVPYSITPSIIGKTATK